MKVKVKLYAYFKDLFGENIEVELEEGTVEELMKLIKERSGVEPIILVNGVVKRSGKLEGEIEVLPPAAGG